jgi:hypothetical protein
MAPAAQGLPQYMHDTIHAGWLLMITGRLDNKWTNLGSMDEPYEGTLDFFGHFSLL